MTRVVSLSLGLSVLLLTACSKLTEPPKPEAIQGEPGTDTTTAATAEAKPGAQPAPRPGPPNERAPFAHDNNLPIKDATPEKPLEIKDLVVGKGPEVKKGDKIAMKYTGTLADGKEFDSSKKHGDKTFDLTLGAGDVIPGWDQGIPGMKVGGKRKLVIPPSLAYGGAGRPPVIPPNATLTFEVELVEKKK